MEAVDLEARDPLWGVLVIGKDAKKKLAAALASEDGDDDDDDDDDFSTFELPVAKNRCVRESKNAAAVFGFSRVDEPPYGFAEKLRAQKLEVYVFEYGKDEDYAYEWEGKRFEPCFDDDGPVSPTAIAEKHGIAPPKAPSHGTRPMRMAGLVTGLSLAKVKKIIDDDAAELLEVPRGIVVLDRHMFDFDAYETDGIETYDMTHYLDSGEVSCTVTRKGYIESYEHPRRPDNKLDEVLGCRDPQAIAIELGIPASHLFPPSEFALHGEPLDARLSSERDPVLVTRAPFDPEPSLSLELYRHEGPGICDLVVLDREALVERLPRDAKPATDAGPWSEAELVELARHLAYIGSNSWPLVTTYRPELVYVTEDRRFAGLAPRGPHYRGELSEPYYVSAIREIAATIQALGGSPRLVRLLANSDAPFAALIALGNL